MSRLLEVTYPCGCFAVGVAPAPECELHGPAAQLASLGNAVTVSKYGIPDPRYCLATHPVHGQCLMIKNHDGMHRALNSADSEWSQVDSPE